MSCACIRIGNRLVPFGEIAYFLPLPTAPEKASLLHLTDNSKLICADFSTREAQEKFGFIYLPKDNVAFSFTAGEIIYNPEHSNSGPTIIQFQTDGFGQTGRDDFRLTSRGLLTTEIEPPLLTLKVDTSSDEIGRIIFETTRKIIQIYELFPDGKIEENYVPVDYSEFKKPPHSGRLVITQERIRVPETK